MAFQLNWLDIPPSLSIILRLWIVFALNQGIVFSVTRPMNTTVFVGERFALNCSTNKTNESFIDWSFFPNAHLNYSNYAQLCPRNAFNEKKCINIISINRLLPQNGNYNLTIEANGTHFTSTLSVESANSSYAGVYQCVDEFGSTAFAFLTVIDPHPTCSENILSDNTLNCSFTYFGLTPQFQWISDDSNILINCTEEGNNYVLCVFKHPLISQDPYAACRLEAADKAGSSDIELFNLTLRISDRSLVWHLQCKVGDMSTTASGVDDSTNSVDTVIVSIAVISGVIAFAIFIVVLLLKRESRKKKEKSNLHISFQTMVDELPHSEDDEAAPVYAEANRNKSRSKTPIYAEVKSRAGKKASNGVAQQSHVIAETGLYGCASYEDDANSGRQRTRDNSPHDCVIYSELQNLGPIADGTKKATPPLFKIREGFERSDYVSVDHTFKTPPAPPAPTRTHR